MRAVCSRCHDYAHLIEGETEVAQRGEPAHLSSLSEWQDQGGDARGIFEKECGPLEGLIGFRTGSALCFWCSQLVTFSFFFFLLY